MKKIIIVLLILFEIYFTIYWQILFGIGMIILNMYNSPGFGENYKFKVEDYFLLGLSVIGLLKIILLLIYRKKIKFRYYIILDLISAVVILFLLYRMEFLII